MALNSQELTDILLGTLEDFADKDGNTQIPTALKILSEELIAAMKATTFAHAPGTVNGLGYPADIGPPDAGKFENGIATGGVMVPIIPATLISKLYSSLATTVQDPVAAANLLSAITSYCSGITGYISTGLINFAAGDITGNATHTSQNPGVLVNGAGTNGKLVGLSGDAMVQIAFGVTGTYTSQLDNFHTSLVNYLLDNTSCEYPANSVNGTFVQGGPSPLVLGTGVGGVIS